MMRQQSTWGDRRLKQSYTLFHMVHQPKNPHKLKI